MRLAAADELEMCYARLIVDRRHAHHNDDVCDAGIAVQSQLLRHLLVEMFRSDFRTGGHCVDWLGLHGIRSVGVVGVGVDVVAGIGQAVTARASLRRRDDALQGVDVLRDAPDGGGDPRRAVAGAREVLDVVRDSFDGKSQSVRLARLSPVPRQRGPHAATVVRQVRNARERTD